MRRKKLNLTEEEKKIRRESYWKKPENRQANSLACSKYRNKLKIRVLNILGNGKCAICGDKNPSHLTIDHIDEKGYLDIREGFQGDKLYRAIINNTYPQERLLNLRVLCFNHNCSRRRCFADLPYEKQTYSQRRIIKLWKEAFAFFGPCATCGQSDLKFLTISHIHNDAPDRRKMGEPNGGSALLTYFRKLGWPESLKEDFCLECYNCNCSRGGRNRLENKGTII